MGKAENNVIARALSSKPDQEDAQVISAPPSSLTCYTVTPLI